LPWRRALGTVEVQLLIELGRDYARRRRRFIGDVHHDAVVCGGVFGDGHFELGRHQPGIAGHVEQMVEAPAKLVTRRRLKVRPAADTASERKQFGRAQSFGQTSVVGEADA